MVIAISAFAAVSAVLAAFLFGCDMVMCLLAAAIAAAICLCRLFVFKKSKLMDFLGGVLSIGLVAFCTTVPAAHTSYGYYDYLDMAERYTDAVLEDDTDKAEELRAGIAEKYRETDDMRYITGLAMIARGDVSGASGVLNSFDDRKSEMYYSLGESVIAAECDNAEDFSSRVMSLYREAAEMYPEWSYVLKRLGGLYYDRGEYEKACYYLLCAYKYAPEPDGETLYFLGASLMEEGQYEQGLAVLEQAREYDVSAEIESGIRYYTGQ